MSKLVPPIPKFLRPAPPRPGQNGPGRNGAGDENGNTPGKRGTGGQHGTAVKLREGAAEGGTQVVGWLDERSGMSPIVRAQLFRKVPKGTNWFYTLGSATLFAFVSQAVTGVFLAMYYNPDPRAPTSRRRTSPTRCS